MQESRVHSQGFREEPESPKHWSYEDKLKPKMLFAGTGDADLRPWSSPRHDQKWSSSCVANAVTKALEIKRIQKKGHAAHVDLSRLAVYYLARELMNPPETHLDEGTYISTGFDVLRRFGVPPEKDWEFNMSRITTPPSFMAMRAAYLNKIESFFKINSTGDARVVEVANCLRAGNPVVFGTDIGSEWWVHHTSNGMQPLPPVTKDKRVGRHAVVVVGWVNGNFIIENSWGTGWGDDGFGVASPELIASASSKDFWVPQAGWESYSKE